MGKVIDLTGQKFGRLTVLGIAYKKPRKNGGSLYFWHCHCVCGNDVIVTGTCLKSGHTKSCGCLQKEKVSQVMLKHGMYGNKFYSKWQSAKDRCYNPNNPKYPLYGGRGIKMYAAWIDDFQAFYNYVSKLEHFGEEGYSLDRIEVNGNYEPGNLRLLTQKEQCRNQRKNVKVEYEGEEITLAEAAERSNICYSTLRYRYHAGKRGEDLFKPVKK